MNENIKIINKVIVNNQQTFKLCEEFANECYLTNVEHYKSRNQSDQSKIVSDILAGKLAEFSVYNYMCENNYTCIEPDLNVYSKQFKNYSADLNCSKNNIYYNLHIKSQTKDNMLLYGLSWLFQNFDSVTYNPKDEDFIVLCQTNNLETKIFYIIKASELVDCYNITKTKILRQSKIALYDYDIVNKKFLNFNQ